MIIRSFQEGAEGKIDGKWYWIGNHRFMHEVGQETSEVHHLVDSLEDVGHSVITMGNKEHICGVITVADTPRKNIRNIIEDIKKTGIKQVVMLTGDNENMAKAMAILTEVDSYHAELLPEDKVHEIEKLKDRFGTVAMIGDGINDAPAMAIADFGIAMGAIGSDAAIEVADIVLMADDLSKIP